MSNTEGLPELNASQSGDVIEDLPAPEGGLSGVQAEEPTHDQKVQKQLAKWIILCILIVYLLLVSFYLFDFKNSGDRLADSFTFALSGLQTLAAAVVGFYYGSRQS